MKLVDSLRSNHILTRAIEKKRIFGDEQDCYRFIFQMYAANVGRPIPNLWRKDIIKIAQDLLQGKEIPRGFVIVEHPPLVHILSFAQVIDHYHFLLIQNGENGIPKYMQKLNDGFAKYINLKNNRKGALFEGRYKSIPIKTDFQSSAIVRYINVINPLDVYQPGWRKRGLKNQKEAFRFLNQYHFSSFPDFVGKRNSKILAPKPVLEKYLGKQTMRGQKEYIKFVKDYLKQNLVSFNPIFLEE